LRGNSIKQGESMTTDSDQYQTITIMTVDGATIQGKVFIPSEERVSDLFTKSDAQFLVMVNAVSRDVQDKTLFINKKHIIWAEPEER
jgi:predicted transcriptional regulator